jgi:hypothetical protein
MNNKRHGKCFFEKNTILSVETVNIQPSKSKTTQDITLPSSHQFFNVLCARKGLTSGGMSATIKCTDNFCFKSSFSNAQYFLMDSAQSVNEILNIILSKGGKQTTVVSWKNMS